MPNKLRKSDSGSAFLEIILIVLVVVVVGLVAWKIKKDHDDKKTATIGGTTATSSTTSVPVTSPLQSGTDNASLSSDLTNINSGLSQTNQDGAASNTAINDQQQEITVPTN